MSNNYIEVIGEASYQELPQKTVLDIELAIRAVKEQTAVEENRELVNTLINQLLENGLTQDEIRFGGRESYIPWSKRRKVGQETRTKITVISSRREIVYQAVDSIDRYLDNKRITIEVSERQPIFDTNQEDILKAFAKAVENAKEKAQHIAKSASCNIGEVLEIQEWKRDIRRSGNYGDSDWWGNSGTMMIAGAAGGIMDEDAAVNLQGNCRTVYIKLRVRYAMV